MKVIDVEMMSKYSMQLELNFWSNYARTRYTKNVISMG